MAVPTFIDGKRIVGLEGGVFQGYEGIKTIRISEGIRFLKGGSITVDHQLYRSKDSVGVFEDCSVEEVQLPSSLEEIGENCFKGSELAFIVIPDGVIRIGKSAFERCRNLMSVEIPDTVIDIGEKAFCMCKKLSGITFPKHLKKIRYAMCLDCDNLSSVVIPDMCQSIEKMAFECCKSLKEIPEIHLPF